MGGRARLRRVAWTWLLFALSAAIFGPGSALAEPLAGELDPSFGDGGQVLLGLGPTYAHSAYDAIVRQPDGAILLAGKTESVQAPYIEGAGFVQRRLADGTLDPSWKELTQDESVAGLALQPDGDVLYGAPEGYESEVHRLLPDGTPDSSYGTDGASAKIPLVVAYLAADAEGRLLVGGSAAVGPFGKMSLPNYQAAVARLLPNGELDKSFGKEGLVVTEPPGPWVSEAVGIAVQSDGSVVLASSEWLFRLTASGTPDPAFGKEGRVALHKPIGAIAQTPAGDLVVAGTTAKLSGEERGAFLLRAFHGDGSPDPTWGKHGAAKNRVRDVDWPTALLAGPQGELVMAGEAARATDKDGCSGDCESVPYLARIASDGSVDASFAPVYPRPPHTPPPGEGGTVYWSRGAALAFGAGGQLLVAGNGEGVDQATVSAFLPSGAADPGFGAGGAAADLQLLPSRTTVDGLANGPGGSLLAAYGTNAATYGGESALTGWSASGARLPSYGGRVGLTFSRPAEALESDASGRVYRSEERRDSVRRFDRGGSPDKAYGTAGEAHLPVHFENEALLVRPGGAAFAVGQIDGTRSLAVIGLTPAGHRDRRFGDHGLALIRMAKGGAAHARAAAVDRRGRVVVFGAYESSLILARLLPDGRLDPDFGDRGRVDPAVNYDDSSAVSVARDGSVYLATSPERRGPTKLQRWRENGTLDRSFGHRGRVRAEPKRPLLTVFAGGKQLVVVSGRHLAWNSGVALHAFHRDGSPERGFGQHGRIASGAADEGGFEPEAAVRQPDGGIVVAGNRGDPLPGEEIELLRFR